MRGTTARSLTFLLVFAGLTLLLAAGDVRAEPRHGASLGGTPKYPAGFSHFDYADPDAKKGGTVMLSSIVNFDTLNPFSLKGRPAPLMGGLGSGLVFESLVDASLDEPFTQYGLLAQTIDIAADALSVTFHLNPKARFADGRPVTAQDVVFTLAALRSDAASPLYRYYYADVSATEAINRRRVRFRFARKNRELALIIGQLPVLPEHFYGGKDFGRDFVTRALGSGPYRVESFAFGKNIRYARRPDHWGRDLNVNAGKYNFDEILVKFYREQTVQVEALKAGEFDFLPINSSKQWAVDVAGDKWDKGYLVKEALKHQNTAGMQGYAFNTRQPIFQNREVRQALALALDFDWLNRNLFYGQYTANDSYFDNSELAAEGLPSPAELKLLEPLRAHLPPAVFSEPMGLRQGRPETLRQRLRRAKRLLNKNGWKVKNGVLTETASGRPMRFTITLVSPAFERITEPYINNLRRLGVQAGMKVVDSSVYELLIRTFDFDMVVSSFGQSQSPGNEQRDYWHSAAVGQEGSRNVIGIKNPAVDALVGAIISADSRQALVTATRALDRALWHGHYAVPQWFIDRHRVTYWNKFGRPKRLPKFYSAQGLFYFWWIDPDREAALKAAVAAGLPLPQQR